MKCFNYSALKLFTGLATAAFIAWTLNAITSYQGGHRFHYSAKKQRVTQYRTASLK
jgi:hypothetical protein